MGERIERAVGRFFGLADVFALGPLPPADLDSVETLVRWLHDELAPCRLPDDLLWLWRNFDTAKSFGSLVGGLEWHVGRATQGLVMAADATESIARPRALVPIAAGEWWEQLLCIDVTGDDVAEPGCVFLYEIEPDEYPMVAADIADVFHVTCDMIEMGLVEPGRRGRWRLSEEPCWKNRLAANRPQPAVAADPERWPERWRDAQAQPR